MIELTTSIPYADPNGIEIPGVPEITHMALVAFKFEPPRASMDKTGYCEFWVAPVYQHSGFNWEPPSAVTYIKIDDQDSNWLNLATYTYDGTNVSAIIKTLEKFLIAYSYFDGTWVLG